MFRLLLTKIPPGQSEFNASSLPQSTPHSTHAVLLTQCRPPTHPLLPDLRLTVTFPGSIVTPGDRLMPGGGGRTLLVTARVSGGPREGGRREGRRRAGQVSRRTLGGTAPPSPAAPGPALPCPVRPVRALDAVRADRSRCAGAGTVKVAQPPLSRREYKGGELRPASTLGSGDGPRSDLSVLSPRQ